MKVDNYCSEIENHRINIKENKTMHSKRNEADDIHIYIAQLYREKKYFFSRLMTSMKSESFYLATVKLSGGKSRAS